MIPKASLNINWNSDKSYILSAEQELGNICTHNIFQQPNIIWLKTSGTTSKTTDPQTWIGATKPAILCSAQAVNKHIQASTQDIWLNSLPLHHIGGLSILARSFLSGSKVINHQLKPWNPSVFKKLVLDNKASLISLVPTQIYDLAKEEITAPSSVRVVFVGGGHLTEELYLKARKLGWPILPTYGMTELCSQIATAKLSTLKKHEYPKLKILPHITAKLNSQSFLMLKSSAMYKYKVEIQLESIKSFAALEYLTTKDQVEIQDSNIKFIQRQSDRIKVLGYLVDKAQLNRSLTTIIEDFGFDSRCFIIQNTPSLRRENDLVLFFEKYDFFAVQKIVSQFNQQHKSAEQIQRLYRIDTLLRTELGKLKNQINIFS